MTRHVSNQENQRFNQYKQTTEMRTTHEPHQQTTPTEHHVPDLKGANKCSHFKRFKMCQPSPNLKQ